MAPAALIVKERNGLAIYTDSPATDKFISISSLASLLRTTSTLLRPRIVAAPNLTITTLTVTSALGATDVEFISERKLPGLLTFVAKAPTDIGTSQNATKTLQSLAKYSFSLVAFCENYTGTVVGTSAGSGTSTPSTAPVNIDSETIDERVNALIVAGAGITKNYDDAANTITLAVTGGGGGSPYVTELPTTLAGLNEPIDDRVNALIVAGAGITKNYDDAANTLTIGATPPPGVKELVSIKDDLKLEPAGTGLVSCKQYWPGTVDTGQGGLFVAATGIVDNVINFASATAGTVWQRVDKARYAASSGATAGSAKPLSSQFSTLALAREWFPTLELNTLTDSLDWACIQSALNTGGCIIEAQTQAYKLNRAFEYFTNINFTGEVFLGSNLEFTSSNALIPRKAWTGAEGSRVPDQSSDLWKYAQNMVIRNLAFFGNVISGTYDPTKSGFYNPYNADMGENGAPLIFTTYGIESCYMGGFAGDAWHLRCFFSSRFTNLKGGYCSGWFVRARSQNNSSFADCYCPRNMALGGYWMETGCTLERCNGYDFYDNHPNAVGLQVGYKDPIDAAKDTSASVLIRASNLEGARTLARIYNNQSTLRLEDCTVQYYCTDATKSPFEVMSQGATLHLDKTLVYRTITSTATPTALVAASFNSTVLSDKDNVTYTLYNTLSVDNTNVSTYLSPLYGSVSASTRTTIAEPKLANGPAYDTYTLRSFKQSFVDPNIVNSAADASATLSLTNLTPPNTQIDGSLALSNAVDPVSALLSKVSGSWRKMLPMPAVQQINVSGAVVAWNSIVVIGDTPLTSNITLTLPPNYTGASITFYRVDSAAFTVTVTGASIGTALDNAGGKATITAVSATRIVS